MHDAKTQRRWVILLTINLLLWGVLSFYGPSQAAPPAGQLPFSNSVQQRNEMIRELREIRSTLREQNGILRKIANQLPADGAKSSSTTPLSSSRARP